MTQPKRKKAGASEMNKTKIRRVGTGTMPAPMTTVPRISNPRVATVPAQVEEKEKKQLSSRQSFSCMECKRLKLKCSRSWPCTSCEKRGCGAICPKGTVKTGKGKRLILADAEELHSRISSLETALAQTQAQQSSKPHPLLASAYLYSPRNPTSSHVAPNHDEEPLSTIKEEEETDASGSTSPVLGDPNDVVDSAFGTLTIGRTGESYFVGSFAASEYYQPGPEGDGNDRRGGGSGLATPPHTGMIERGFEARPTRTGPPMPGFRIGGYADDRDVDVGELRRSLPNWEAEGSIMVQNYWDNVSLMHQIIPQHIFEAQYLQPAYDIRREIHAHKLAVVFLVMATGVMFDLQRPAFDDRGAELSALGQACLSLVGFEHAIPSTVRALHLCGTYVLNDKSGYGAEVFWPVLGTAIKVAYSLGLHRDGTVFGLSAEETEERRSIWWELVSYDRIQSICFARPSGIQGRTADTQMPSIHYSDDDHYHHTKFRMVEMLEKVNEIQTQVAPVTYSLVKSLDMELVEFKKTIADILMSTHSMSTLPFDATVSPHLIFHRLTIRLLLAQGRLLLNRPFFAMALKECPEDPSWCKHGDSFCALFEAAQETVQVVQRLIVYHPSLVARWWVYWFHAFSSACCFAAICIQAPKSAFATQAYDGLITVFDLARATPPGCRAKKGLPVLFRLQARAQDSMRHAGRQGALNASFRANQPGRYAPYVPSPEAVRRSERAEAGEDDDLGHLSGKIKLRRMEVKESHLRSGSSGGGGESQSPTDHHYTSPNPAQNGYAVVPYTYTSRPRAGTGTFTDFMVSPSSAISASTSATLADQTWEGVVPPPAPLPLGFDFTVPAMANNWGDIPNVGYYNLPQTVPIAEIFPTLISSTMGSTFQPYQQDMSGNNQHLWSPDATSSNHSSSFPGNNGGGESSTGFNYSFQPQALMPTSMDRGYAPYQYQSNEAGPSGYGPAQDAQTAEIDMGKDLDLSLALGFGDGSTGGGMNGGAWDWDTLMNARTG